jgi:hypothetical protein
VVLRITRSRVRVSASKTYVGTYVPTYIDVKGLFRNKSRFFAYYYDYYASFELRFAHVPTYKFGLMYTFKKWIRPEIIETQSWCRQSSTGLHHRHLWFIPPVARSERQNLATDFYGFDHRFAAGAHDLNRFRQKCFFLPFLTFLSASNFWETAKLKILKLPSDVGKQFRNGPMKRNTPSNSLRVHWIHIFFILIDVVKLPDPVQFVNLRR